MSGKTAGDPLEDGGESAESIALALADAWLDWHQKAPPIGPEFKKWSVRLATGMVKTK